MKEANSFYLNEKTGNYEPLGSVYSLEQAPDLSISPEDAPERYIAIASEPYTFNAEISKDSIIELYKALGVFARYRYSNNRRKYNHEPLIRKEVDMRKGLKKRTQIKQGKLRNKRHYFT